VNPDSQHSRIIFIVFLIIAAVGYVFLLKIQPHSSVIQALEAVAIPYEKKTVSGRKIVSLEQGEAIATKPYLICVINDDPDDTNAYGIYDPTDLAVTVNNLHRLGITHLFLGTHLHWQDLPTAENNTLSSQLEILKSCVISVPLRRAAESIAIPPYLLRSSLEATAVHGNTNTLPRVNNLTLPPTIKIPANAKVGFSKLESEPASSKIPLLAKWDERVVLSSLLLERMHHLGVEIEELEIHLGKWIILGKTGNKIAINEFGYFTPTQNPEIVEPHIISAEITSLTESPLKTKVAALTASGVKADSYQAIDLPVEKLTQLANTEVFTDAGTYYRISWVVEIGIASLIAYLLSRAVGASLKAYILWSLVLIAILIVSSISLTLVSHYYAPVTHLVFAVIVCAVVSYFLQKQKKIPYFTIRMNSNRNPNLPKEKKHLKNLTNLKTSSPCHAILISLSVKQPLL